MNPNRIKKVVTVCFVILIAGLASGQWLETTIPVSDSHLSALCYCVGHDYVYCVGESMTVIDGQMNRVEATIGIAGRALCYNLTNDKAYCAGESVVVIDCASNRVIALIDVGGFPGSPVSALCYNSSGDKVYCATVDRLTVIDGTVDRVVGEVDVGGLALCYNPTSNKVYCANSLDNSVGVIDCGNDHLIATEPVGSWPTALCYNATDNKIYCANSYGGSVTVIDGTSNWVTATVPVGIGPCALCYNRADDKIYCANSDMNGGVTVIDGATDHVICTVPVEDPSGRILTCLCHDSTNNRVYCLSYAVWGDSGSVTVIDGIDNQVVCTIAVGLDPRAVVLNPVQNRIYVANPGSSSISVLRDSAGAIAETQGEDRIGNSDRVIARGVLRVPQASKSLECMRCCLLDISGREVMGLRVGQNDVSCLAPGVYFVQSEANALAVKVVILK